MYNPTEYDEFRNFLEKEIEDKYPAIYNLNIDYSIGYTKSDFLVIKRGKYSKGLNNKYLQDEIPEIEIFLNYLQNNNISEYYSKPDDISIHCNIQNGNRIVVDFGNLYDFLEEVLNHIFRNNWKEKLQELLQDKDWYEEQLQEYEESGKKSIYFQQYFESLFSRNIREIEKIEELYLEKSVKKILRNCQKYIMENS